MDELSICITWKSLVLFIGPSKLARFSSLLTSFLHLQLNSFTGIIDYIADAFYINKLSVAGCKGYLLYAGVTVK